MVFADPSPCLPSDIDRNRATVEGGRRGGYLGVTASGTRVGEDTRSLPQVVMLQRDPLLRISDTGLLFWNLFEAWTFVGQVFWKLRRMGGDQGEVSQQSSF